MGRRASGEGSIYPIRNADGKIVRYGASITVGYKNGKRDRKKVERRTRREVAEELARLKAQAAQGMDLTARQPKVKDFCTAWLDGTFALKAKPKSVETYRHIFTRYIFPALGESKVKTVMHRQAQALVTKLHQDGSADNTVGLVRTAGRQAFAAAMKEGLTDRNPFQGLTLPKGITRKPFTLTVEQCKAFLAAARGERLEVALRLLLSLGLRRGEVCGLRWEDIDLTTGVLTVNGTLQYIQRHGLVWGTPKSKSGIRSIKLPPSLLAALVWHQGLQEAERREMGERWANSGYVFVSPESGGPLYPEVLYCAFKVVAERAELPDEATPHTLRHSCASFLHAEGASLKKISTYLGHANTVITNNIYIHLFQDEINEAAATVEGLFEATGS